MLVVPSASEAVAVISAEAPFDTSSESVLLSESESVGAVIELVLIRDRDGDCLCCYVPTVSVAVTMTTQGFAVHVIDRSSVLMRMRISMCQELASNRSESVPESV